MRLEPLTDLDVVHDILTDPEMWERIKEDGNVLEDFVVPDNKALLWLGIHTDDGLAGLFFIHNMNLTTIQLHAHILEPYRKKYAKEAGRLVIAYFANEMSDRIQKLIAEIPVCYPDVYHFSLKNGLIDEGLNRLSVLKNGEYMDQHRLGITKEEAKAWLQQQS
ncbi:GNAT family N-acetyltransferase [Candidatus Pacearchaeota archaeon]|nr:GNAT family N-acetyltransferase [Candidatus Pacearchaeota archaeon]